LDLTKPLNDYFNEVTNANRDLVGFRGMNDELAELKLRLMLDAVQSDEEIQMLTSYNNKRLHNYWYDDLKQAKRLSDLHNNSVRNLLGDSVVKKKRKFVVRPKEKNRKDQDRVQIPETENIETKDTAPVA
jgi:hypothetical protein